jgi:hypothetical protein
MNEAQRMVNSAEHVANCAGFAGEPLLDRRSRGA